MGDGVEAGFVEVEFVFDLAEDLVADEAFVAEADGGFALDLNELAAQIDDVSVIFGVDAVLLVGLTGDSGKAALVFGEGVVESGGEMVVVAFTGFPAFLDVL